MATKLYFHNASNTLSGTFPTTDQSVNIGASITAATSNVLKTMNNKMGLLQTSMAATTLANNSQQTAFMGFFCSPPLLGNQTIYGSVTSEGVNTNWTLNVADSETNTAANFWINNICLYVWRPSTGSVVGYIHDNGLSLGGSEATLASSIQVTTFTINPAITNLIDVNALDGDVIICEFFSLFTQGMNTSYTVTVYYDGTTENLTENAVVTNHASFLQTNQNIYFKEITPISVGHPFMF